MSFEVVPSPENVLSFLVVGQPVRVVCEDPLVHSLLLANFGAMAAADDEVPTHLQYSIAPAGPPPAFSLIRQGQAPLYASDPGDLLFLLEKDLTVELQKRRADLFFLHSAAIEWQGKAFLLAAEAGSGKSTTTWALLHHEFNYLSDELSPIDLDSLQVHPYSHALCLKRPPPPAYPLPRDAVDLGRTIHVPTRFLPSPTIAAGSRPLAAVFLLRYLPDLRAPEICPIGAAEATARLYVTALNALSHPNHGLDAVVHIARHVPCFAFTSGDLPATCAQIISAVDDLARECLQLGK
jgi:hypothetical protein